LSYSLLLREGVIKIEEVGYSFRDFYSFNSNIKANVFGWNQIFVAGGRNYQNQETLKIIGD